MELNLQIIKEELLDLKVSGYFSDNRLDRRLEYPTLYNREKRPEGSILYLADAAALTPNINFDDIPSFIVIGQPPEIFFSSTCNFLYTEVDISINELLNQILKIFNHYYHWEKKLQALNNKNLPLKALAELSEPFFKKPFTLIESNFRIVFSIVNKNRYPMRKEYEIEPPDNSYLDIEEINLLKNDLEFSQIADFIEPSIYSEKLYGLRALFYNVRINGFYVARLIIYEIGSEFTDRDFALAKYLGDILAIGMIRKDMNNFNQPSGFEEIIKKLLDHIMVDEEKIVAVLTENQWQVHDDYFCISVEPSVNDDISQTLSALAIQISSHSASNCFVVYNNHLVFLFNLTKTGLKRDHLISYLLPLLRDCYLKAGISSVFSDFKNFYYYYRQAEIALSLGKARDDSFWYYRFEDYCLPYIVMKSKEKLIPEVLCPEGLLKLLKYDQEKNTSYYQLLRVFLENNMSIAQTTRDFFIHRNTFLYRIDKINEIIKMDLNKSDVRLSLLLAFKIMDGKQQP